MSETTDPTRPTGPGPEPEWDEFEGEDPLATVHRLTPVPDPRRPGALLLNRFRLLHRYDGGGQSAVWAAWELAVRRFVVLKFVHPRLLAEAQRAANVPGATIGVFEYNDTAIPGSPFLVLEFARGGPVGRLREAWAADPRRLVERFIPVVRTLAAAHAAGTVHRDLKPNNLLLWSAVPSPPDGAEPDLPDAGGDDPGAFAIRVADWGMATGDGDDGSGFGGTPGFAAPEQWTRPATPAADLFGLAATLYHLLTGAHPMPATMAFAAGLSTGTAQYTPPAGAHAFNRAVDPRLSGVLSISLAADPALRHSSAGELADELERWLTGRAVRDDSPARRARLWGRRNWAWASGLAVAAALAVALVGVSVANAIQGAKSRADVAEARAAEERAGRQRTADEAAHAAALGAAQKGATARRLAEGGNWAEAVRLFDELLADAPADRPDALALRVDRLHGLLATGDLARFRAEMDALGGRADLPDLARGVVRAYAAERLSWNPNTADQSAAESRAACALLVGAGGGAEPVAWRAVRAHLAARAVARPLDRLAALRRVATDHPFFFPVRRDLMLALAACGKADEAEIELRWMRQHYPQTAATDFAAGLIAAVRTPAEAAPAPSDRPVDRALAPVRAGLREIARMPHPFDGGLNDGHLALWRAVARVGERADEVRAAAAGALPEAGLPYAAVEPLAVLFGAFRHYHRCREGRVDELRAADAALTTAAEEYPDGTILVVRAVVRMMLLTASQARARTPEEAQVFVEPAAWLDDGCRTATVLPSVGLLYMYHVGATAGLLAVARLDPADPAGAVGRLESLFDRMKRLGRESPLHRKLHAPEMIKAYAMKTEEALEAELWKLNTEYGVNRLAQRKRRLAHVVMGLLHDWVDHELESPDPWYEMARLGEQAGYPPAWVLLQLDAVADRPPAVEHTPDPPSRALF